MLIVSSSASSANRKDCLRCYYHIDKGGGQRLSIIEHWVSITAVGFILGTSHQAGRSCLFWPVEMRTKAWSPYSGKNNSKILEQMFNKATSARFLNLYFGREIEQFSFYRSLESVASVFVIDVFLPQVCSLSFNQMFPTNQPTHMEKHGGSDVNYETKSKCFCCRCFLPQVFLINQPKHMGKHRGSAKTNKSNKTETGNHTIKCNKQTNKQTSSKQILSDVGV